MTASRRRSMGTAVGASLTASSSANAIDLFSYRRFRCRDVRKPAEMTGVVEHGGASRESTIATGKQLELIAHYNRRQKWELEVDPAVPHIGNGAARPGISTGQTGYRPLNI